MSVDLTKEIPEEEKWDLIIKPKTGWFEINFKEIWRYRDLVLLFVRRDFAAHYTQTVLGPLWHIMQPILTTLMFILIFSRLAKLPSDGINPTLFYMSGITMWNYFSFSLTNISATFVVNANMFGKVYFPRIIIPISIVFSNMIRFGIQFALLLATMALWALRGETVQVTFASWIWIPALALLMVSFSLGLGIVISAITTKYRDFSVLLTFVVQLYMYATPIAYPMSYVDQSKWAWLIRLNPLAPVVEGFRYCLFGKATVSAGDLLYSISVAVVLLIGGLILFHRVEKRFMDTV